jgi:hypothetical protein
MKFEDAGGSVAFSLYAVIIDGKNRTDIREWLAECALQVPDDLGFPSIIEALPASEISFETIETLYCGNWIGGVA